MRHLLRRATVAGIALTAALVVASPASAADKSAGTLTIPDKGSSDILSWSWGVSNPVTIGSGGGGAGAGKLQLQPFALTKRVNPLSTELTRAVATGAHFDEVTISAPIGGPGAPFAIEYRLRQVIVESLQQGGTAGETTETVSMVYGAFNQTIGNSNTPTFGLSSDG
jgi:type VI protein secretion system component Hcp